MRIGIIDLGTNTFNLLIVESQKKSPFKTLMNTKSAVMLGSEGLDKGYISDKALERAYIVLQEFRGFLNQFSCDKIMAFGTSAIRSASNAQQFIDKINEDLNIQIETLSGDREAEFIYYGVKEVVEFTYDNYLILDIGGGSNEFIIANKNKWLWKQSFPLGGVRLIEKFKPSDPITDAQVTLINNYLNAELQALKEALKKFPVTKLVGASGAFDSFAEILHFKQTGLPESQDVLSSHISLSAFDVIYKMFLKSSREERLLILGLEEFRVDTVVLAAIFTKFSLELSRANEILHSTYSLKEGAAAHFGFAQ